MIPQTVIGWDLGKHHSQAAAMHQADGRMLKEGRVENTPEAIGQWLEGVPRPIRVVLEATEMWQAVYDRLEGRVEEIQMAHPQRVKAIASARIKTDKIDARTLAHLGRADLVPQAWIPPKPVREWRELLRYRASLTHQRTSVKNRLHGQLAKAGITPPRLSTLFGKAGLKFWREVALPPMARLLVDCDLRVLEHLGEARATVTARIEALAAADPRAAWLTSIRGLGPYSAMLILAEVGDIHRFGRPEQLVSYAGLAPSTYQSGATVRHGRITRQGSKWLRWVLVEATLHYVRASGRLATFYHRLQRRKGTKIARVALARELARAVFWVLTKEEPYREPQVTRPETIAVGV